MTAAASSAHSQAGASVSYAAFQELTARFAEPAMGRLDKVVAHPLLGVCLVVQHEGLPVFVPVSLAAAGELVRNMQVAHATMLTHHRGSSGVLPN